MRSVWHLLLLTFEATMTHQLEKILEMYALNLSPCLSPTQSGKHVIMFDIRMAIKLLNFFGLYVRVYLK